ncbi:hypothetical protein Avbf_05013 [Armadillidium vulgare]|nr:hypothetical protein Avbf_05013 [Armadillidium vulgare]
MERYHAFMVMIGSLLGIPFILAPILCIGEDDPAKGQLISTILFASGIVTLLQSTFGVRLPIIQGGTFTFIIPTIAIITTSFPSCEKYDFGNLTQTEKDEVWMPRMREIQGAIIVSSLFQVILAIFISWAFCGILTASEALPSNSEARTDINLALIQRSPWFYIPYPFQWGLPSVTVSGVFGMLAGVIPSMIESVGDYYACARLSGVKPPPKHAMNRGICIEGIGCIITGILGTGNGTVSYSENIGAIRVTRVASRRVIQVAGLLLIFCGMFGKIGAFFGTLPNPVIGGTEEERGVTKWKRQITASNEEEGLEDSSYDLPFGMSLLKSVI